MNRMRYKFSLLVLLAVTAFFSEAVQAQSNDNHAVGGDFTLTDHNGNSFKLSKQSGKVVLLFFGYTSCTEACPIILTRVNSVFKQLGSKRDHALAVFISVDPERDTPQVLSQYVKYFSGHTIALTGKKEEIDQVVKQYGAKYEVEKSDSALNYHVNHTTDIYLIDSQGVLRSHFKHTDRSSQIAESMKRLMK